MAESPGWQIGQQAAVRRAPAVRVPLRVDSAAISGTDRDGLELAGWWIQHRSIVRVAPALYTPVRL